ncbi:hypothetical protein [Gramella sp. MAR_2010_147]|uniref:hypothetical protein n=1 Tax=Gramella sp. MAR_2010_147 TaxID=1250205 RepID=UPI000879EF51|nr:hypothetical protein [Gramella sp. MAR_2010_147]SDR71910.1 hypothetical protein SAMN04488553_0425 [Gramella sp. MAR_2010_147]
MNLKIYIALFFILLFGGKLLIVDSGVIEILSHDLITVVNPFCKKNSEIVKDKRTVNFQLQENEIKSQQLSIASLCSPQLKLEIFFSETEFRENIIHAPNVFTSRLSTIYLDHLSPPPKLA